MNRPSPTAETLSGITTLTLVFVSLLAALGVVVWMGASYLGVLLP